MDNCPAKPKTWFSPRGFLSSSSADGGQSSGQSFVHMTSAPAMIGYTRKMFRSFVGIARRQMFFVRGQLSKILNMFDRPKHCFGTKVCFFYPQTKCFRTKIYIVA
jgi:hypothetical protein